MNDAPSLSWLEKQLLVWFSQEGRTHLPWRKLGTSPYEVWVSEIMLQQTQVSRVIPYFEKFLQRFPTVESLAHATWEEFFPYYAGLGYYRRGRNMLLTAQKVVAEFGGKFPRSEADLRSLPGVGPYTAKAILSFAFDEPHLSFDTNHQRVFGRYLHGDKKASIDTIFVESQLRSFQKLNAALMDFANDVCVKTPRCESCPLQQNCRYFQTQGQLETVSALKKSTFPSKSAQTILVLHRDHQEYFSSVADVYKPFLLSSPLNTRARIKAYFLREYGLELAIRPPHLKGYLHGEPTLFMNAQVLLGTHAFSPFSPSFQKKWMEELDVEITT